MSEFIKKLKEVLDIGKGFYDTALYRRKLSTILDIFTEKVIPTFVNEKDLKDYYEKKMDEVNEFIYKL